jgi:hypothetical protein
VSVKKAKGKSKEITTEKPAKVRKEATAREKAAAKVEAATKKEEGEKDVVQVRERINELVKDSAEAIAVGVIEVAKTGQLAPAKYLFEAAGIYPAMEQTGMRPIETSLAHTLLTRMGVPLDPVICDEEPVPVRLTSDTRDEAETAMPMIVEKVPEGERAEDAGPVLVENEE